MLLAIDVGNTNIVIGVFRGETLVHSWRLTTIRERTSDELGILISDLCDRYEIRQSEISGIVIRRSRTTTPPLAGNAHDRRVDRSPRAPRMNSTPVGVAIAATELVVPRSMPSATDTRPNCYA